MSHKLVHGGGVAGRFWDLPTSARPMHPDPRAEQKQRMAAVCLACTKSKCTGKTKCFRKMQMIGVVEDEE